MPHTASHPDAAAADDAPDVAALPLRQPGFSSPGRQCASAVGSDAPSRRAAQRPGPAPLRLSPDSGIVENIGEPLPFEVRYWAGERRAEVIPWPDGDDEPYALPFHPLEMGEDALRALCGFIVEGRPDPGAVDADTIRLHGFPVRDPDAPGPAAKEAALRAAAAVMGPPRTYVLGPDGALIKRDALWPMAPP